MKKILSIFLVVAILVCALPLSALTASAASYSGSCGDNVNWSLDTDTGVLTISGSGNMTYYSSSSDVPWYAYRSSIKEVVISDGVTRIGDYAFYYCTSLNEITIPDSVTRIGYEAFYYCDSLTEITIPDSVTHINRYTFYKCTSLTEVTIGNSVTSIGYGAFEDCTSLTSITIPDSVTSIGDSAFSYCRSLTEITIPDSVTGIGYDAFSYCNSLTEITIPDGVTRIDDSAFYGCTSLTEITIPDSVTSICDCAFSYCTSLVEITIPDSVTSIGDSAFSGCTSLADITIPDSVTSIGVGAFSDCDALESIVVQSGNPVYHSAGNCIIETETKTLIVGCKNSIIPTDNSVTSIGNCAFYGCTSLAEVTIGNSVTSIGKYAFYGCTSLAEVTIGNSVTSIGGYAFYKCTSLAEITIPDSVASIGHYAFEDCTSLNKVNITDIAAWYKIEFAGYSSNPTYYAKSLYLNGQLITELNIPDGVTSIGSCTFYNCTSLTEITIPDSVTSIGSSAFRGCTSLAEITIPDSVTSIGEYAFYNTAYYKDSNNLKNDVLYINNHLIIAKYKISGSYNIKDDTITIAGSAFSYCDSLTEITIPDSVTSIGDVAFIGCTSLKTVNNYSDLPIVKGYSDYGYVGYYADTVNWYGTVTDSYGENLTYTFDAKNGVLTISGSGDMTDYSNSSYTPWYKYRSLIKEIVISDSVTSIGDNVFADCTSLTKITIPDSVTSIGDRAFYNCSNYTFFVDEDSYAHKYAVSNDIEVCFTKFVAPDAPMIYSKTTTNITLTPYDGYEYKCGDNGTWQTSNVFSGLKENTTYYFYQRKSATEYAPASAESSATKITTKYCPQKPSAPTISYIKSNEIKLLGDTSIYEYKINDGNWQSSLEFSNLTDDTEYTVYVRVKETYNASESEANFLTVKTPQKGVAIFYKNDIPLMFYENNATSVIYGSIDEYSVSRSGYEFKGWSTNSGEVYNSSSDVPVQEGTVVFALWSKICSTCEGEGVRYSNVFCFYCNGGKDGPFKTYRHECSNCGGTDIRSWIANGQAFRICNKCKSTNILEVIHYVPCGVCSGKGSYQESETCENCDGSKTVKETLNVAPPQVEIVEKAEDRVVLLADPRYEYSIDGTNWQKSNVFYNLTYGKTYNFYQRIAETEYNYASEKSTELLVVLKYDSNVTYVPTPIIVSVADTTVTLKKIDGYEYKIEGGEWQKSNVFTGLLPDTEYVFYQRVAETNTTQASVSSDGATATTLKIVPATPSAPTVLEKTETSITLVKKSGYEYKIEGGEWQTSNVFTGLSPNTKYTFYQRVAETNTSQVSSSSAGVIIKTNKPTPQRPSAPTILTVTDTTVTLKKIDGYEYKMNNGAWQTSGVFEGLSPNTEYTFYQRVAEIDTTYASESSVGVTAKTNPIKRWVQSGSRWWYDYGDGTYAIGWDEIDGTWYYFDANGWMQTGWKQIGKIWYYFKSSGAMVTNWQKIGGVWYFFKESGAMVTGWFEDADGTWYYFNSSGAMQTGWEKIGGVWYYFNTSGAMKTGWLKLGGTWYYFTGSGAMVTGNRNIGGKVYRFNSSGACLNP